jgi:hypothetical protein
MRRVVATTTRLASRQIRDLMQSVLVNELINPSARMWLVSAWIVDAPVVENRGGEFSALMPSWPEREMLLSEVLAEYLGAGTHLVVVTNDHPANRAFPSALQAAAQLVDAQELLRVAPFGDLTIDQESGLHRKRFVTERAVVWGSMNFTFSGMERNAEDVELDVAADVVASAINEMEQLYPTVNMP